MLSANAASPGTVVAWGDNYYGQTTVPTGLSGVTAIAAGGDDTVALKSDGTVVAWGGNRVGQATVPAGLSGVTAIAAGWGHTVALKSDGTVVAWGDNRYGVTTVPAGLSGVTAIAAGSWHTVALKSDGTVVAWGLGTTPSGSVYPDYGQSFVPAGLSGVTAIAAGSFHTVALKSDGTMVTWGSNRERQRTVPVGLSGVTAIAAGGYNTVALKSDGTVVAWGLNSDGQTNVPAGLSGVTAIAAGGDDTVALKSDGTVVAWGWNGHGQTDVPAGLSGVTAVAAGDGHTVALVGTAPPIAPTIITQPVSQTVQAGVNVTLSVTANGTGQLFYQWRKNGVNISGATSVTLTLNSVGSADSAGYSIVVWNAYGSVVSGTAYLAVLTEGANGTQPARISVPTSPPPQPTGVDSLIIVTHGWEPEGPFADISWITDMANAIRARVPANYVVMPFSWVGGAWFLDPDLTLISGASLGRLYARYRLIPQHWKHVHLIAHSAGSAVIEAMAQELKSSPNPPVIHETFLDPYTGLISLTGRGVYGANADWADNYSALGGLVDVSFGLVGIGNSTVGKLDHAYNVDVGWVDPKHWTVPFGNGQVALASHGWPHDFYLETITNSDTAWCAYGSGFRLSKEGGGWNNNPVNYSRGLDPVLLCGVQGSMRNPSPQPTYTQLFFNGVAHAVSSGVNLVSGWFTMSTSSSQLTPQAISKQDGIIPQGPSINDGSIPAWLAVGLPVTNTVNYVQFDASFTSTNQAEGLLTVYWNTNEIGIVDERVAPPGLQSYRFALPATMTNGLYTLSFRLDAFNNTSSSIMVTNAATGFLGVAQQVKLSAVLNTNGRPLLQLSGASGYNYLLQSSSNLANWTPTGLVANTNGTVLFSDPTSTNSSARFYRAVRPF